MLKDLRVCGRLSVFGLPARLPAKALCCLAFVLVGLVADLAQARPYRRTKRHTQAQAYEDRYGVPAYGGRARGMARARRARWRAMQSQRPVQGVRPAAPLRKGVWHPVGKLQTNKTAQKAAARDPDKEDLDDDEEVESVDTAAVVVSANAEGPLTWWGDAWPVWDRVLDSYTARTVRKHTFNTIISHRNYGGWLRDPGFSLFGFDSGSLKVLLGLRFGIFDVLDVGLTRLNGTLERFDTYEFDARYSILRQERFGIDLGLRAGLDWYVQEKANDAIGGIGGLMIGRLIANRVYLGFNMLYSSNSSGPKKSTTDIGSSAALQLAIDTRISSGFCLPLEVTYAVAGYRLPLPNVTFGPKWVTNRHMFAIVLSNTQYILTDGIVTNNDRKNFKDWVLGFHITREL